MFIEIGKSIVDMLNFNLCIVMFVGRWYWNGWFLLDCFFEIYDILKILVRNNFSVIVIGWRYVIFKEILKYVFWFL